MRVIDEATAREAHRLVGRGPGRIVNGIVRAGDGGFNSPWPWHLDPATVQFADVTIELCDGCPAAAHSFLNARFCPWSSEVIGLE